MEDKKTLIEIEGVITKNSGEEISEKEYDFIVDSIIKLLNDNNYNIGGGFNHVSEKRIICGSIS